MKFILTKVTLVFLLIFILHQNLHGQRSRFDYNEEQEVSLIFYDINLGNLAFFGSQLSLSGKGAVGYKIAENIGIGAHLKTFYNLNIRDNLPDIGLWSYGTGAFTKIGISAGFFVQAEYNLTSYEDFDILNGLNSRRTSQSYPLFGGGYFSGNDRIKYGLTILYIADETVRNIRNDDLEWWLTYTYNF